MGGQSSILTSMKKMKKGKSDANPCCGGLMADSPSGDSMCANPDECAQTMKVLSDSNRIKIVRALITGPSNVGGISKRTGLTVHRISHHLGRMRLAGLVECTRDGRSIVYQIAPSIAVQGGLDLGCACILFRALP
jgi:DNA-binding transcriptional ArsR family regulator